MRTSAILGCALSAAVVAAQSCPYPGIESALGKCKTGKAYCSTVLGRGPKTTTVSVTGVYTTTVASTLPYSEVRSSTVHITTTLPTLTVYETLCTSTASGAVGLHRVAIETAAVAAIPSCNVGQYKKAWVKTACECEFDSTTYIASKTKTTTGGITIGFTSATRTTTTTAVSYSYSTTSTTTIYHNNCAAPTSADCLNPEVCPNYEAYECGSGFEGECACGFDAVGTGTCFEAGSCEETCVENYDCEAGSFCLYDSCCGYPICSPYDICVGDQTYPSSSSTPSGLAKPTGFSVPNGQVWNVGYNFGKMR